MRCKGVSPFESARQDGVPASRRIKAVLAKLRLTAPEIIKKGKGLRQKSNQILCTQYYVLHCIGTFHEFVVFIDNF